MYRPRRTGERKRKSARGCICGPDLAVIALKIIAKGEKEIPGLTDAARPRRLGPKRAANIIAAFALRKKKDDVRKYVVKREIKKGDKTFYKAPKIQRLITEQRIRRKTVYKKLKMDRWKASKEAHVAYEKLLSKYLKEKKAAKKAESAPAPVKTEAPKTAPAKTAPAKTEAPKTAPAKQAAVPAKQAPVKTEAPKTAPAKTEAPKTAPAKQAAAPAKQAPAKQAPAQAAPAKKGGKK